MAQTCNARSSLSVPISNATLHPDSSTTSSAQPTKLRFISSRNVAMLSSFVVDINEPGTEEGDESSPPERRRWLLTFKKKDVEREFLVYQRDENMLAIRVQQSLFAMAFVELAGRQTFEVGYLTGL